MASDNNHFEFESQSHVLMNFEINAIYIDSQRSIIFYRATSRPSCWWNPYLTRACRDTRAVVGWSGHGTPKSFPECRRHERGRARVGGSPSLKGGSGDLPRENNRFRKAVDAFYCIYSEISVYKFSQFCKYVERNISDNCYVCASDNTNILNTTISTPQWVSSGGGIKLNSCWMQRSNLI